MIVSKFYTLNTILVSGQRDFTLNFKKQIQKKFPNHPNLNYTDYKKIGLRQNG